MDLVTIITTVLAVIFPASCAYLGYLYGKSKLPKEVIGVRYISYYPEHSESELVYFRTEEEAAEYTDEVVHTDPAIYNGAGDLTLVKIPYHNLKQL